MTKQSENKNKDDKKEEKYVADFDKDIYMEDVQVETKDGRIVKVKDWKKQFRKKGTIERGKIRTAEAFNVPVEQLDKVSLELNHRKIDNVFINDLLGRHGFYDGTIISRADLARKIGIPVSVVEIAVLKLAKIIKHIDFKQAYREYLDVLKAEKKRLEEDELSGGSIQ